jgi:hypothetical protein
MDMNAIEALEDLQDKHETLPTHEFLAYLESSILKVEDVQSTEIFTQRDFKCHLVSLKGLCILKLAAKDVRLALVDRPRNGADPYIGRLMRFVRQIEIEMPDAPTLRY